MLKNGMKTTEFWMVIMVVLFAVVVAIELMTPSRVQLAADRIGETAEAIPVLVEALRSLAESLGPLLVAAGSVWAYLKRRTELKKEENQK